LSIDVTRSFKQKGEILITSDQLASSINRYMRMQPTTKVLGIHPDSILIRYQKLSVKELPVELVSNVELVSQYMLSSEVSIKPSKVLVYGPKSVLDTMVSVKTELVDLKNLKDTTYLRCKLKPLKSIRFSGNNINLCFFVEPFTERKIQIPIGSINCPENLTIRTFPAFVNATFIVGLSHFKTFNTNDLQVYLDYNTLQSGKFSKQKLIVKNNSTFISNIRISPEDVEFVLEVK
jgi:YbbR domain-containing protein